MEFFEARVVRPETPCWNWRSYINRKGYGTWKRDGISTYVHRVAWELLIGPIPAGYEVHHICCNRSCVNPHHLQLVTHAENIELKGRRTHCVHGHEFSPENTYVRPSTGQRLCRECRRTAAKIHQEAKRRAAGVTESDKFCKNGHERTPENTYVWRDRRRCRDCESERRRKPGGYKDPARERATHCPHGHEYTPENTYEYPTGARYCRACSRVATHR